tara:strand:+ start:2385 stop:2741 length:357 start_codon:yes stop_codon:yes gene_type:complete
MKTVYQVSVNYNTSFFFKTHAEALKFMSMIYSAVHVSGVEEGRKVSLAVVPADLPEWEGLSTFISSYFGSDIDSWRECSGKIPDHVEPAWVEWAELGYADQRDEWKHDFRSFCDAKAA